MVHGRNTNKLGKKVIFRDAEYNNNTFKSVRAFHSPRADKFKLRQKVQRAAQTFFQSTTIHGVVYLARQGLHIIER